MFLSQQVKWNVIITSKIGKYELTDELPNDLKLKKISKLRWNYSLASAFPPKMKILSIIARDY